MNKCLNCSQETERPKYCGTTCKNRWFAKNNTEKLNQVKKEWASRNKEYYKTYMQEYERKPKSADSIMAQKMKEQAKIDTAARKDFEMRYGHPDLPPSALVGKLPSYYIGKWFAGSKRLTHQAPEGYRTIIARKDDRFDVYCLPSDIPAAVVKCALRWHYKAQLVYGKDCEYVVR